MKKWSVVANVASETIEKEPRKRKNKSELASHYLCTATKYRI
jgi:hypothetical protein